MSPGLAKNANAIAGMTKMARRPSGGVCRQARAIGPTCARRPSALATHSSTPMRGAAVVSTPSGTAGKSPSSGTFGPSLTDVPSGNAGESLGRHVLPEGTSYLAHAGLAEDAARPDEDDGDQEDEHVEVVEGRPLREVPGRVRLEQAEQDAPDHRPGDAPDAA